MKRAEKIVAIAMLMFSIGLNLWLYRLEPTARIDPNDNTFQFALVDRTNQIWDFAKTECSKSPVTFFVCFSGYLVDHWVPNWAQGYNLPYYYSHIPQIAIVASWRILTLFTSQLSLFSYYHWIIYFLLCFFPLTVFLAMRVIRLPWLISGIGAVLAAHVSTDGLYGLDPPSFLWRGYGLSSQLFAMIWLPLAIAYAYRYFQSNELTLSEEIRAALKPFKGVMDHLHRFFLQSGSQKTSRRRTPEMDSSAEHNPHTSLLWRAVFFMTLTIAGHLGIGVMALMSAGFLAISAPVMSFLLRSPLENIVGLLINKITRLGLVAGTSIFFLSYWIIFSFTGSDYHNFSFWDPIWKFNSYGWQEVLRYLFNGDLFDFGRLPVFTGLVLIGMFVVLIGEKLTAGNPSVSLRASGKKDADSPGDQPLTTSYPLAPFAFLFIFWLAFYFGRTTWNGLIDLIPGMKEVHLSRFIVGVHMAGIFLAPIGLGWILEEIIRRISMFLSKKLNAGKSSEKLPVFTVIRLSTAFLIIYAVARPIYGQTILYNELNERLIRQANENVQKSEANVDALFTKLRNLPPGRIFAGRGGGYGKAFEIAETPMFMHISTYGLPTVLWLPETWSPNSDTEQYFSEDQESNYDLYNIRYVVAPHSVTPKPFWTLIAENPFWNLYETTATGYITTATRPAVISTSKYNYINIVHQWIQSDNHVNKYFPELRFSDSIEPTIPAFKMVDEVTYELRDGSQHNLFAEPPTYGETAHDAGIVAGSQSSTGDMIYRARVQVGKNCERCIAILKHSDHPNWRVTINGRPAERFTVFPFFIGITLPGEGTYDIEYRYQPNTLKIILLVLAGVTGVILVLTTVFRKTFSP